MAAIRLDDEADDIENTLSLRWLMAQVAAQTGVLLCLLDALLIIVLPYGPTAHFKLSNLIVRKDIKNHGYQRV
ncbi:hypothetical protein Dimus_031796 [Dionaea muscipula]